MKTGLKLKSGLALIVITMTLPGWAAEERPRVGDVKRLAKEATATYENDTRRLNVEDNVFFQDLLETGVQARLAIKLKDDTMLTLGENASLRVDEFVYEPDADQGELGLSVLEGAFLYVGGRTEDAEASRVEVETPVGTLGVRGTTVWGGSIDGSFGVLVTEGRVTVRNAAGEVELGAGEGTQVESMDTAPSAPKTWPREKIKRALQTVSFSDN